MKKVLLILLLLISTFTYSQVITTKVVKIPNATLPFVDNIPAFVKIINQSNYKEYLVLQPLSGIKSLSTCILGTDIIESGLGSYKYSNDSTGTTSGYVSLARFYSTVLAINNVKQNNLGFTPYNSTNPAGYISSENDPTIYSWAKASVKPTYTKSEIGLDSVVNHKQWYSGFHPTTPIGYGLPDYPVTLPASDVYTWAKQPLKPNYTKAEIGLSNVTNNIQWHDGNHPTTFTDYGLIDPNGVYLPLSGGSIVGTTSISVPDTSLFATLDVWASISDTTNSYGLNAMGVAGGNRKIFRAGMYQVSNGLTIDWKDSTNNFEYTFNNGLINITGGVPTILGLKSLQLPTGSTAMDAGLSVRLVTGESIVQFGNNFSNYYTGNIVQSKSGSMVRLDTRDATPIPGGHAYSAFQVQVRGAGVAYTGYTVPIQVSGSAPEGAFTIGSDGIVHNYYGTYTNTIVLGSLTSAPTGVEAGIYYNTTDKHFYGYNGTIWKQLDN